jgi:hypothetical protein
MSIDNGYISRYLIHWAGGKKPDRERADILSTIASTCRLRFSPNEFFFDGSLKIGGKMICFTDVPLSQSAKHCAKYSPFGIAFHKLKLMGQGAQPVFYFTHVFKKDMGTIYRFVIEQLNKPTIAPEVLRALHRHFYFMQEFAQERADRDDTAYYEREWRIGESYLIRDGQDEGKWYLEHDEFPPTLGTLVTDGDETYFKFKQDDVAFLVVPKQFIAQISNPHQFDVKSYETLIR